jgi:hypothetical protein
MILYQGNTYKLPVKLTMSEKAVTKQDVKNVEFSLGKVIKNYPENVTFEDDAFVVYLSQDETLKLEGVPACQVRVLFNDGSVKCTDVVRISVRESISKVVLE